MSAECGVFSVGITGGEPLIRNDFLAIADALKEREIDISAIYTNGWLVDKELLDALEERELRPSFQLSFDGLRQHDFLRGVPGSEEKTIAALKLLYDRGYSTSVSMCLHRRNTHTLRETVRFLASLGVESLKCGSMMELSEWADPSLNDLRLSRQEELEIFEQFIPQYFEDDAPLSIMLSGAFIYIKGDSRWNIYYRRNCSQEKESEDLACPVLGEAFYIGADGIVAPCQGICDSAFSGHFPSLKDQPLRNILTDSDYVRFSGATVGDVRNGNADCRQCEFIDRCAGGCRNAALIAGSNYYGVDPGACFFFKNGWEERIAAAAEGPFKAYKRRI